jgi:TetR/AcrR family transcriptional regulator
LTIIDRKEREKERRKKEILDAAEALFFTHDYEDVSMDSIARDVELNKATLYLYFKNKESLFYSVVLRGVRILNENVKKAVQGPTTGIEMFWNIWTANIQFRRQYPEYSKIYTFFKSGQFQFDTISNLNLNQYPALGFIDFEKIGFGNDDSLKEIIQTRLDLLLTTRDSITRGIADGTIRDGMNALETAVLLNIIMDNISNVQQDQRMVLASTGIDEEQFINDAQKLVEMMLSGK